jgi:hypothetical protein
MVACRSSGAAWSVALTTRSSGRVHVTPSRRRALKPWARLSDHAGCCPVPVTFFRGSSLHAITSELNWSAPILPHRYDNLGYTHYRLTELIAVRYPYDTLLARNECRQVSPAQVSLFVQKRQLRVLPHDAGLCRADERLE